MVDVVVVVVGSVVVVVVVVPCVQGSSGKLEHNPLNTSPIPVDRQNDGVTSMHDEAMSSGCVRIQQPVNGSIVVVVVVVVVGQVLDAHAANNQIPAVLALHSASVSLSTQEP